MDAVTKTCKSPSKGFCQGPGRLWVFSGFYAEMDPTPLVHPASHLTLVNTSLDYNLPAHSKVPPDNSLPSDHPSLKYLSLDCK